MKVNKPKPNFNYNFKPQNPIFLSKKGKTKKINRKLNTYLFNKILYSFKI